MATPERIFLGWDGPLLRRAADWLLERHGASMGHLLVALPGRRAGRDLEQALVEAAARRGLRELEPPEILTAGRLSDRLVRLEHPAAGGTARTFAWWRALRAQDADTLRAVTADPPADDDGAGWIALAHQVRALHARLAAEGCDFAAAAAAGEPGDARRWRALSRVQERYRALLREVDLVDPHEGRRAALDAGLDAGPHAGRLDADRADPADPADPPDAEVVLVGVVDAGALVRRAVSAAARVTALVFAPEDAADGFDAHGFLVTEAWTGRSIPFDTDHWTVVDHPRDQAEAVTDVLASWEGRFGPGETGIGVPDEQVVPYVERRLRALGLVGRDARGTPLSRTGPVALLAALAGWLEDRRFDALAALARHPDVEAALLRRRGDADAGGALDAASAAGDADDTAASAADPSGNDATHADPSARHAAPRTPAERLDDYHAAHLPARLDGHWPDPATFAGDDRRAAGVVQGTRGIVERLERMLGDLAAGGEERPSHWARATLAFLQTVYGGRELALGAAPGASADERRAAEMQRRLADALVRCRQALVDVMELPAALDGAARLTAAATLAPVLERLSSERVPAPADGRAVELLGWLELALDPAPALVVTGFNDGVVPAAGGGEVPPALAAALGLPDEDARLARDAYLCAVLAARQSDPSRALWLVSGRRSAVGDPLIPSRLLFHAADGDVVERVERFVSHAGRDRRPPTALDEPTRRPLPRLPEDPPVERMSVTSFKTYLSSPYEFYLQRVARVESVDDVEQEMDGRLFGSLAHAVLEAFGRGRQRHATDSAAIQKDLERTLDRLAAARFAGGTLPAVAVQLEQLRRRLRRFAKAQAAWAADGWRIRHVEWSPAGGALPFEVDGTPMMLSGQIDRIDHNERTGAWAVLDYKTGEKVDAPGRTHGPRRDGTWTDLQLPLYGELVRPLGLEGELVLGYVLLTKEPDSEVFSLAGWSAEERAAAVEAARGVVRDVRAGRFDEVGRMYLSDPVMAALAGAGLLGGAEDEPLAGDALSEGAS